jgi:hypothetical protein
MIIMKGKLDQVADFAKRTGLTKKRSLQLLSEYWKLIGEYMVSQEEILLNGVGTIKYKPYKVKVNQNLGEHKKLGTYSGLMPKLHLHKIFRQSYQKKNCKIDKGNI